jgi:hypothetical protein
VTNVDDLDIMRDFCAEEAPPDPHQLGELRARLVAAIGTAPPKRARQWARTPSAHPRPRLAHPRLALAGVVAVATAAAVTAALAVPPGTAGRTVPPGAGSVQLDAAVVLHRAAQAALATRPPASDRYVYIDSESAPAHQPRLHSEMWLGIHNGENDFLCRQAAQGSRQCSRLTMLTPAPFSYAGAAALPTQPRALLRYLDGEQARACGSLAGLMTTTDREWSGIVTMLYHVPLPSPRLGAALMEAAAQIPGIQVNPKATTIAGQPGIGVALSMRLPPRHFLSRSELIFSPRTYRLIGASFAYIGMGPVTGMAVLRDGFTSATPRGDVGDIHVNWGAWSCDTANPLGL